MPSRNLRISVRFKTEMAYIDHLCQPLSDSQRRALARLEAEERKEPWVSKPIVYLPRNRIRRNLITHPLFD